MKSMGPIRTLATPIYSATLVGVMACATPSAPPTAPAQGSSDGSASRVEAPAQQEPEPEPKVPARIAVAEVKYSASFGSALEADTAFGKTKYTQAQQHAAKVEGPTGALLRARVLRALGKTDEALAALEGASDPELTELLSLERGMLLASKEQWAEAAKALEPVLREDPAHGEIALLPLAKAWAESAPQSVVDNIEWLASLLPTPKDDVDARTRLLALHADSLRRLEKGAEATQVELTRYLEEPVSTLSPQAPPKGIKPTDSQLLARAEALLEAHRNERVVDELTPVGEKNLSKEEICRRRFSLGLAHRKLRHYSSAERFLTDATKMCDDENFVRRGMYLLAKVVSIKDGLRAIPIIEDFAKRFSDHSMVDDVLFWAGDMYQRRRRYDEAIKYYSRIETMETKGDHCGDARWRIAWIAYRRGKHAEADEALERVELDDGCVDASFDRARARYWRGNIASRKKDVTSASAHYTEVLNLQPLGFYAQLALKRLSEVAPEVATQESQRWAAPEGERVPPLCTGWLAEEAGFERGMAYLVRGLGSDAAAQFRRLAPPEQQVLAGSHAVNQGKDEKAAQAVEGAAADEAAGDTCLDYEPSLLLTLLLDKAGAHREAHWRLRTEFAELLERKPTEENVGLYRAAYPLAYRPELKAAEEESKLPTMFLQALSREESAFDAEVVSWAGAYGLTQLLLSTGKNAGKLLSPPVNIRKAEELLEPSINARLGGAFMGSLFKRYKGNAALSLAAYNASERVADTWWRRHAKDPFDVFTEEMTIRETRGYVKRVLKTYGIYRWLYAGEPPALPIDLTLPPT